MKELNFKLNEAGEAIKELVVEYTKAHNDSPFTDISIIDEDTGEINIDMKEDFEKMISEVFETEEEQSDALGNYFSWIIGEALKDYETHMNEEQD
jgi:uncharacterized protein with HEPN domain